MKKKILIAGITGGVLITASAAFALLGGNVTVPDVAQGLANGGNANPCQTGPVNFVVSDPVWHAPTSTWRVNTVTYDGISAACVTLATADLELKIVDNNTTLTEGTVNNMGANTGTITLNPAISFDMINGADFVYLVVG